MEEVRPEDQKMSGEWICQIEQIRNRQNEEHNILITQIKQGLKRIVWDGSNTEEIVAFCLNWLNSNNENSNRDWKNGTPIVFDDKTLVIAFYWEFGREEFMEVIHLAKGDAVSQAVNTCDNALGPMRSLSTHSGL